MYPQSFTATCHHTARRPRSDRGSLNVDVGPAILLAKESTNNFFVEAKTKRKHGQIRPIDLLVFRFVTNFTILQCSKSTQNDPLAGSLAAIPKTSQFRFKIVDSDCTRPLGSHPLVDSRSHASWRPRRINCAKFCSVR
jgi:hypothetical protein